MPDIPRCPACAVCCVRGVAWRGAGLPTLCEQHEPTAVIVHATSKTCSLWNVGVIEEVYMIVVSKSTMTALNGEQEGKERRDGRVYVGVTCLPVQHTQPGDAMLYPTYALTHAHTHVSSPSKSRDCIIRK